MRSGITETFWNEQIAEHHRFFWTVFVYVLSATLALSVIKTPSVVLNTLISVYVGINSIFIIHFHRKYSRFPRSYQRAIERYSLRMFLSGWYIICCAITVFTVLLFLRWTGFSSSAANISTSWYDILLVMSAALLSASMLLGELKEWGFFLWLVTFPREAFVRHITLRSFQVNSFRGFAAFELYVVFYSFFFIYMFSSVIQIGAAIYAF